VIVHPKIIIAQNSLEEKTISNKFDPNKCKARVSYRVNIMEKLYKYLKQILNFFGLVSIIWTFDIINQVKKQPEKRSLLKV